VLADSTKAVEHLRVALERHEEMGARPLAARTHAELARLLHLTATLEAVEHLAAARATAADLGMSRLLTQISTFDP
jgi:hypothetical protein